MLELKNTPQKNDLITNLLKKKKYKNTVDLISIFIQGINPLKPYSTQDTHAEGLFRVILTLNNVFIFVVANRKMILSMSTGQLGFKNTKKNLFTTAWLLGRTAAEFLVGQISWKKLVVKKLIVHNASSNNYRLKFVLRGLKDNGLKFNSISFVNKTSFNGCKKKHLGRTGRKRKIFFS
jgi:ribosomal protein S11